MKTINLPIVEPLFATYQHHVAGEVVADSNETYKNWYYNNSINLAWAFIKLTESLAFSVTLSDLKAIDFIEHHIITIPFVKGIVREFIYNALKNGYCLF